MAHAKLSLQRMLTWIETRLEADEPAPSDAQIMELFGFASTESARTLLAELADAGKITIKGYGETRVITLGRALSPLAAAARAAPTVRRADMIDDARVEQIRRVLAPDRGARVEAAPPVPPAPAIPVFRKDPEPMPASKSITFVATGAVLEEIKRRTADGTPNNRVAIEMLEEVLGGSAAAQPATPVGALPREPSIASIQDDLQTVFAALAAQAERPDLSGDLAAMTARAEAAERKLAALREALAE